MAKIFDFAVMTIFAREVLEASVIIVNYRTIIKRSEALPEGVEKEDALRAITVSALVASFVAIAVIAIVAIPLGLLSRNFDPRVSTIIEGVSKIVAAICILQLSLKMPKWLGVYSSTKEESMDTSGLTLRSIRFNVAWNIWREVAECGAFLLPFFLTGENIKAIPLSAVTGTVVGLLFGAGIHYANRKLKSKLSLAIFTTLLLLFLSTGLFSGGCHNIEYATRSTTQVWSLDGDFWSVNRLPMTIFKPFGFSDTRTVLQIVCFWSWLALGIALHVRKYYQSKRIQLAIAQDNGRSEPTQEDELDVEALAVEIDDCEKITLATEESLNSSSSEGEQLSRYR